MQAGADCGGIPQSLAEEYLLRVTESKKISKQLI